MSIRHIILDTETTGLEAEQGHRIIEIGCVEMINRRLTKRHFHCYLNPEREVDAGAVNVHGLTSEFLKDKPKFAEVVDEFLDFVNDAELIIHNAPFDMGFLNHELRLLKKDPSALTDICSVIDTLLLARRKHPGQRNSLDALCQRYSIDNSNRELHGALLDAELLAQVYLAMTGGQGNLFQEEVKEKRVIEGAEFNLAARKKRANLVLIQASIEEEQAHQAILEKIQKTAGSCVWLDS